MASAVETTVRKMIGKGMGMVAEANRRHMPARKAPNPYLTGMHEPMGAELTLESLPVDGEIPADFEGRYFRNGPNPVGQTDPASYHWFTGDAMVHGLRLSGGKAWWYRNRWVRSTAVSAALGEAPAPGQRAAADTANTNIIGHAGRYWAIVEAGGYPVELDGELATLTHNPWDGTLDGPFSAHPHRDPVTGELHAICYQADIIDRVWHTVVDAAGRVVRREPIAVEGGPSIHDCAITENWVIVFDLPVTFSVKAMLGGQRFPYRWNPGHKARIGLCPRTGSGAATLWCDVDPCYVFHPGNAFEQPDGTVIVDLCVHDRVFHTSRVGPDPGRVPLERWSIDPAARAVRRFVIDAESQEFPRYDERLTGQPYRYLYTMGLPRSAEQAEMSMAGTCLLRHDLVSGTRDERDFGPGRHPGEFVFVPREGREGERDGWLAGLVIDMNREATDFVILDAADFTGPPRAVIHLPHRIPPGFHGNWIPDADLH